MTVCWVAAAAGVRVPNVPAGDHFLFIYAHGKDKKPTKVFHLHPGRFSVKTKGLKNKTATGAPATARCGHAPPRATSQPATLDWEPIDRSIDRSTRS